MTSGEKAINVARTHDEIWRRGQKGGRETMIVKSIGDSRVSVTELIRTNILLGDASFQSGLIVTKNLRSDLARNTTLQ